MIELNNILNNHFTLKDVIIEANKKGLKNIVWTKTEEEVRLLLSDNKHRDKGLC